MRKRWAGLIATAVALLGLTATIVAEHILPEPAREPRTQASVNVAVGRFNFAWRSKTEPPPPQPVVEPVVDRGRLRRVGVVLGIAALCIAVVSWVRGERAWLGVVACSFAVAAIAWQTVVIVFALLAFSGAMFTFMPTGRPTGAAER